MIERRSVARPWRTARLSSGQPELLDAVTATLMVVALPSIVLLGLMSWKPLPMWAAVLVSVGAMLLATIVGTAMWNRHPASERTDFLDLMLWSWIGNKRSNEKLADAAQRLGFHEGKWLTAAPLSKDEQMELLRQLMDAIEEQDEYTRGHCHRVARLAHRTAAAMHLSTAEMEKLRRAAEVHDVGKIKVPAEIVRKPGKLTPEERAIVESHSIAGAEMVSVLHDPEIQDAVLYHHERWDGRGYPYRLKGREIPLLARIIAVADTYDALASTRAYRARTTRADALEVIRKEKGTQFDPEVVEAFLSAMPSRVAAAALFVPFLPKILGEVALWMRRFGARSYAPAAASVMVLAFAASLGGSKPELPSPKTQIPVAAPPHVPFVLPEGEGDEVLGTRFTKPKPKPEPEVEEQEPVDADVESEAPEQEQPDREAPPDEQPPVETPPVVDPPPVDPPPVDPPPVDPPPVQPESSWPRGAIKHRAHDPQPDHGKDTTVPGTHPQGGPNGPKK